VAGTHAGLASAEAARRLAIHGPNVLVPATRWRRVKDLARTVADPMAIMLAAAAAVYLALGEVADGVVLALALVPVLAVDLVLERRARRTLAALSARFAPSARVVRDGRERAIPIEELVPGDLVVLAEGDLVFADAEIAAGQHLALDESHLTGESEPLQRGAGDPVHAGSRVIAGRALATVTATGPETAYAAIAALVAGAVAGKTPLQHRVGRLVRRLGIAAVALAVLLFALLAVAGGSIAAAALSAISLAMAAIPEEFPLVLTIFLALGAARLSRRGVLVRRLAAVEALGSTTVICIDKTGTLTHGRFELAEHRALAATDAELLTAAALACELATDDAMERAILAHCGEHGVDVAGLHARWELAADHPFEVAGKHMTHVWRSGDRWRVVMKGALEGVAAHCDLDAAARDAAERAMTAMGRAGMRVLAVAARDGTGAAPLDRAAGERGLTLLGLVGFRDPLRPEVPAAVAACRAAGIELKVVTGDHAITARAIAEAAGLAVGDDAVSTGDELAALAPADRADRIRRATVLARIRPEQKYEIVDTMIRGGEVVAMTGDGINDAPALRRASIGISMGEGATEVARAAAGLVLLRDDLGALVDTVAEGRRIHANLQRAFLFLVGFHVPIIALAVVPPVLGLPLLLLPIHLVWLELIVHPVAALAFEDEAGGDVLDRPPRPPAAPILPRRLLARAVASGAALAAGALAIYALRASAGVEAARAAVMATIVLGGLGLVWAELALDQPWRAVVAPRRRRFWIVVGAVAASLPFALAVPPLRELLALAPPSAGDVAVAVAVAVAAVAWRAGGTGLTAARTRTGSTSR
jgi:Ca2+-transporting ATPase